MPRDGFCNHIVCSESDNSRTFKYGDFALGYREFRLINSNRLVATVLILFIALLAFSPLSGASSAHVAGQNWMFAGSEFNYSQRTVIREPTYDNVTVFVDYFEVTSVSGQQFNFTITEKNYNHLGLPQNRTLPVNASIVVSKTNVTGSFPGNSFFVVNGTILKQISRNATLYFNYKNATAPLNISSANYSYGSMEIPSYRLTALEPRYTYAAPGQSQSYVYVNITLLVDASNGIVLYENENQSYAETTSYDTVYTIEGANFQMIYSGQTTHYDWTSIIIGASILAVVFVLGYVVRTRRR